jgi:4'-phosphopantetheinyl transferase
VKCQELAERFFSPREAAELHSLPATDRRQAFFHCWTRKEAYIKAIGRGLSMPLDGFDVSLRPGQPAQLLAVHADPAEVNRWQLASLTPAAGFVAAVIVERPVSDCWFGAWPDPFDS